MEKEQLCTSINSNSSSIMEMNNMLGRKVAEKVKKENRKPWSAHSARGATHRFIDGARGATSFSALTAERLENMENMEKVR